MKLCPKNKKKKKNEIVSKKGVWADWLIAFKPLDVTQWKSNLPLDIA